MRGTRGKQGRGIGSWRTLALTVVLLGTAVLAGCGHDSYSETITQGQADAQAQYLNDRIAEAAAIPDPPATLPAGKTGATELPYMVQLGEKLIRDTNTDPMTAPYIPDSGLTCSSCHVDAGKKKALGSTFIGSAAAFPAFNPRDGGIVTLQDRINSCFMRSMNGIRLPANSEPMLAMVAYITWLSEGTPIHMNADRAVSKYNDSFVNAQIKSLAKAGAADPVAGKTLYENDCATCHGTDGAGSGSAPPVWGPASYNKGAGLANNFKGATWVQFNMPPGQEFTLTDHQALDIMAYVDSQPHPDFVEDDHLPNGGVNYGGDEIIYHYGRNFTDAERSARVPSDSTSSTAPSTGPDGATLYASNCAVCHGDLATSTKTGATAAQIQNAIDTVSAMQSLSSLTTSQVQAIATALAQ